MASLPDYVVHFAVGSFAVVTIAILARAVWKGRERGRDDRRRFDSLRRSLAELGLTLEDAWGGRLRTNFKGAAVTLGVPASRRLQVWIADDPSGDDATLTDTWIIDLPEGILPLRSSGLTLLPKRRLPWGEGFGLYLSEPVHALAQAMEAANPAAESLAILSSLGLRGLELACRSGGRLRADLELESEDLLARPDRLESLLHHLLQLRKTLAAG